MSNHATRELLSWIQSRNDCVHVSIRRTRLDNCQPWYYDASRGEICNSDHSFFQITGLRVRTEDKVISEQPIILQNEIGYLGIIRKRINGELHYLMQAKIEPGNINKIQLSPTIQATKSNFTQKHGGEQPAYLDYFINASKYKIVVDQIQSEQSSRFLGKRNRNIVIEIDGDIEVLPSHRWMTMEQIKALMRYDNLVNMDTRTVLSCLPLREDEYREEIEDESLLRSIRGTGRSPLPEIYQYINNYKMFHRGELKLMPLHELRGWRMTPDEIVSEASHSFKVVYYDIEIEGREVRHWRQPLFEAAGIATFALMTRMRNGTKEFLVRAKSEVGCFDGIELGPSVQQEYICGDARTEVDELFDERMRSGCGIQFNTLLSEEGGRFFCEQNRNVILEIDEDELRKPPEGYFWVDMRTLLELVQVNNCLNIQLRNLLSVLEWKK